MSHTKVESPVIISPNDCMPSITNLVQSEECEEKNSDGQDEED